MEITVDEAQVRGIIAEETALARAEIEQLALLPPTSARAAGTTHA